MFKMTYLKIFLLLVSVSLVSSIPLQGARFQDDDQETLETLAKYIKDSPQEQNDKKIEDNFMDNPRPPYYSPDMSLEDLIDSIQSSDDAKDLVPDLSESLMKLLESGSMNKPDRYMPRRFPPRERNTLAPMTTDGNKNDKEEILEDYEMATLDGLRRILNSAIKFLKNRLRRGHRTPEEYRDDANGRSPTRDPTRNLLDTVGNRLHHGGAQGAKGSDGGESSDGGVGARRGNKDVEMERFGLGQLVNIIMRILMKFENIG